MITFSAPGKIHLLGEHVVVYGKPALLATVDLKVTVTVGKTDKNYPPLRTVVNKLLKKKFKVKQIPPYSINSEIPAGSGLGFSAASSAASFAALLTFLKIKWDLDLVNELTFEAEKVFHGNPSGADNSTVVFGGLIWFTRTNFEKQNLSGFRKLAKNFVLIHTGTPKETTKEMVEMVKSKVKKIFDHQEELTKELVSVIQQAKEKELIRIIKEGEENLESIGVASKFSQNIIRQIEKAGGAAKICGGGGKTGPTGVLLCYHPTPSKLVQIAKSNNLDYFRTTLGVEGLREEP